MAVNALSKDTGHDGLGEQHRRRLLGYAQKLVIQDQGSVHNGRMSTNGVSIGLTSQFSPAESAMVNTRLRELYG